MEKADHERLAIKSSYLGKYSENIVLFIDRYFQPNLQPL